MRLEKSEIIILIIAVVSFIVGIFMYDKMPQNMASHWNLHGEVDGYLPKVWGVFILPFLLSGLAIFYLLIPRVSSLRENIQAFTTYYYLFAIFSLLFLFGVYIQMLLWNVGTKINFLVTLPLGLGLLFIFLGVLCENAERNWFIGMRTSWTLESPSVWRKTNQLAGKLLKLSGGIAFLGIVFSKYAVFFMFFPVTLTAVIMIVYSYFA
ncbi:MAG: DUF1648 domain-containing protein [Cyanobacteria bacterium P01_A01_bin.40]